MAAFLKNDASTNPDSLKQASGTDYQYSVDQILTTFAATDTGVGTLSVNPASTTGLTSIGTFTDTYYPYDQNQHPVGTTITSTTYTFYQDLQSATETLTRPLEFSAGSVQEQTDTSLNGDLISTALSNLVSVGVGSYALQPTTPVGGTWVSKATITNNLDVNESNVTYLWRKTAAASSPTTVLPLKINSTSPVSVKEMSDAEIQTLTNRMRNRITATGIGKYAIQSTAPVSGGTWTTSGTQFIDTTRTQSTIAYNGTYVGTYAGGGATSFTGTYQGNFTGVYSRIQNTNFTGNFTGTYSRVFVLGPFSRPYTGNYAGTGTFRGFVGGVTYSGGYTGFYQQNYTGAYTGGYNQAFTGSFAGAYTGIYSRLFTGIYSRQFTGSYTGSYTGAYSGVTLNNDSSNVSDVYLWIRTA